MPSWDNTPHGTMRAAVLASPGASPPVAAFRIETEYPKPSLPARDSEWLLVRVHAAGLNRGELRARDGEAAHPAELGSFAREYNGKPPAVLGEGFVGVVEDAGDAAIARFPVGALVAGCGFGGGKAFDGAYAQYTIALPTRCWRFEWPGEVPWSVVGAVPVGAWTAYNSLFEAAETKKGDTVLVHGATSSVGMCYSPNTRAGADHVILESELQNLARVKNLAPNGVNTILELVGPNAVMTLDMPLLARKGTVVVSGMLDKGWSVASFTPAAIPSTRRLTFSTMTDDDVERVGHVLQDTLDKVRLGVFKSSTFLDKVFELQDVGKAHEYMEESQAVGKVVLRLP